MIMSKGTSVHEFVDKTDVGVAGVVAHVIPVIDRHCVVVLGHLMVPAYTATVTAAQAQAWFPMAFLTCSFVYACMMVGQTYHIDGR